jgi:Flp pilus assembly protein TadG
MKEEGGQALIELGLLVPVLMLLLVGAVEFGAAAYAAIEVSDAAGAAISYGAQNSITAADTTGIQTAAQNDAPDITLGTTTVSTSCICSNGTASTCLKTDCSTSNIETILTVQTQTTFTPWVHVPGLPSSYTFYGHAVRKVLP